MINHIPHWKPPRWRDPEQKPIRNYQHHPELILKPNPDKPDPPPEQTDAHSNEADQPTD
jgi:hypothetical protein